MQEKQSHITHCNLFCGLNIYSKKKSKNGMYTSILAKVLQALQHGASNYRKPQAIHLVIDSPDRVKIKAISQDIERFLLGRSKHANKSKSVDFIYLYVIETKPRKKTEHLHLAVIADGLNVLDIRMLEERMVKFSKSGKSKIQTRRFDCLPVHTDPETGEVRLNKRGEFARKGSLYYHDLRTEFSDAFERFSYLAKVYSKDGGTHFSCSRFMDAPKALTELQSTLGIPISTAVDCRNLC